MLSVCYVSVWHRCVFALRKLSSKGLGWMWTNINSRKEQFDLPCSCWAKSMFLSVSRQVLQWPRLLAPSKPLRQSCPEMRWGVFSIPVFPGQPELEFRSDESSPNLSSFRHNIFHWLNWHLWKLFLNSGSSVLSHAKYQQGHNRQTLHISGNKTQLLCLQCCYCFLGTQTSLYCWMHGRLVG